MTLLRTILNWLNGEDPPEKPRVIKPRKESVYWAKRRREENRKAAKEKTK